MLTIFGLNGSASMSAIEWIGASQVMRSRCGASTGSVSSVSAGSSIHASGKPPDPALYDRVVRLVDDRPVVGDLELGHVDDVQGREPRHEPAVRPHPRLA